jgi:threonylcarbamoyladenosine tRNA methylthiotransferase MtaB
MPQLPKALVKARAAALRAAGDAALGRHLDGQTGRIVSAIVERAGLARAEDFTEIGFDGPGAAGDIIALRITGRDGAQARGERP